MEPTPFVELNRVLDDLVAGARDALGESFVGAYLQGSFAVGDADVWSDVDFIVATDSAVDDDQVAALRQLHRRVYALERPWAQHLEGSYVPRSDLRRPEPLPVASNCRRVGAESTLSRMAAAHRRRAGRSRASVGARP